MSATKTTIRARLRAKQDGAYINYVFENLNEPDDSLYKFLMITQCPNWQNVDKIYIGDEGYLTYEYAEAGNTYIDPTTEEIKRYKYTALYFMNFIKVQQETKNKDYNF